LKEQLQLLLHLQQCDLERDAIRQSRTAIAENLADANRVLEQLRADLAGQMLELKDTVQLHKEKTREHKESEERYKQSKTRLSKVSNTKEYAAIELELENLRRQDAQLEEELLQLMEAIDTSTEAGAEKEAKIEALSEQIEIEKTGAEKKITGLERRLGKLTRSREKEAATISTRVIRQYEFIRSRRGGTAIVAARGGCCQGCFMQLPPQLYIELQRGSHMHSCPSCLRILFYDESE
jgi:predicted  nucleic acid-binding Zn-ribbon protein